jgi:hypothetical protein
MALDKKQIALTVVGIVAGLALTYLLWMRSQTDSANEAATAAANAAATAAAQEQEGQQYDSAVSGLSDSGGSGTIYEQAQPSTSTTPGSSTGDDASDLTSLITTVLGQSGNATSSVPANSLIPEVNVSDGSTTLSGIDTSAAQILGNAAPSSVTTTTSTGQTYGATSSNTPGSDSNNPVLSLNGSGPGQTTTTAPPTSTGGDPNRDIPTGIIAKGGPVKAITTGMFG